MTRPPLNPAILSVLCLVLAGLSQAATTALDLPGGLRAEYFAGEQAAGAPAATVIDDEITTSRLTAAWNGTPPAVFTARWFGFITIWRDGDYTFATTSDDASSVTIDGNRVVENGGIHGPTTVNGHLRLSRGSHAVLIEYQQRGGGYEVGWSWARGTGGTSPVPGWVLTSRRVPITPVLVSRALHLAAIAWLAAALLFAPFAVQRAASRPAPTGDVGFWTVQRHPAAAALALFVVMAIAHTWPLASDPAHLSRSDNSDTMLNEWILAWVAHQAPRAPGQLFEANIFHPEHDTLAYSEALIVQSAIGAPVLWLGGSPVLAYNLVLIAGFALTGWTMSLVMARWTGSSAAALVSGLLFAFNAHTLTRIPHLQAQHAEFLPLAVFALDRLIGNPTVGRSLQLALWFTLQALTSVYLMVFTTIAMVAAALVRPDAVSGGRARRIALMAGIAGGVAALVLLPFLLPYWRVNQQQGLTRSLADAAWYSATWRDYLSTPARLHYLWWSQQFFVGTALFPGGLALLLAAIAIVSGRALSDRRARMCLAIGVAGVALSFGPSLPGYSALYQVMPLLRAIRATARFGYLGIFAVAALAGFGVTVVQRAVPARRWETVAAALVLIAALEPTAAPLGFTHVDKVASIYSHLPVDAGAVVEFPFFSGRNAFQHAPYMLNSTSHWRPLVNGYSGFQPASFHRNVEALRGFPDQPSVKTLSELGVTHMFVHDGALTAEQLRQFPQISLVETSGGIALYRLR